MSIQQYDETYNQANKVAIVANPVSRCFNVVLDSYTAASFTGALYNATFSVDLKTIVREAWRLNKAYYMTFQFVSATGDQPSLSKIYTLHIDLGKAQNIYRYSNVKVPSGIVRISTDGNIGVTPTAYLNSRPEDNAPVLIENLRDITNININLLDTSGGGNGVTFSGTAKYICILTFMEA